MKEERIKIRLYGVHLFYVSAHLLNSFKYYCEISDFTEWLKENVYDYFGIVINSSEMIKELESAVKNHLYENIGEWAKETMRKLILSSEKYLFENRPNC